MLAIRRSYIIPESALTPIISFFSGFQSTNRGNALAKKIVASDIKLKLNDSFVFYTADNCT